MDNPDVSNQQSKPFPLPRDSPPEGSRKQEGDNLAAGQNVASQQGKHSPNKTLWVRWQEHTLSDRVMAYFTGVVALCAALQIRILVGGSSQTDHLITAANTSAQAADHTANSALRFARSAERIDDGIVEAVKRLEAQANALDQSRKTSERESNKALQSSLEVSRLDQRAWMGVSTIVGPMTLGAEFSSTVISVNTGRTPALHVTMYVSSQAVPRGGRADFTKLIAVRASGVVPPSGGMSVTTHSPNGLIISQPNIDVYRTGQITVAVFGKVTYSDVFGRPHWQTFCYNLEGKDLQTYDICDYGNNVDGELP